MTKPITDYDYATGDKQWLHGEERCDISVLQAAVKTSLSKQIVQVYPEFECSSLAKKAYQCAGKYWLKTTSC